MKIVKRVCSIVVCAIILSSIISCVTTVYAGSEDITYIDIPDSQFGMFAPCDDGRIYLVGMNKVDFVNWLALIAPDGKVEWQISYDDTAIYRDIIMNEDGPILFVTKRGIPNRPYMSNDPEMTPYFLPVSSSGTVKSPILLPNWTQRSYVFQSDQGILLYGETYSDGPDSLKMVMYGMNFVELWNLTISDDEMPFDYCQDCIQTDDGFMFYGTDDKQQSVGIVKCSLEGDYEWSRTYQVNASSQSLCVFNGTLILLAARWTSDTDTDILFVLGEDGSILWEKTLIDGNSRISLRQIIPLAYGCLVVGHKSYGEEKPFLFIQTLDSQYNVQDEIDISDINEPMNQVKYAQDARLYLAGMHGAGNNSDAWRIVYRVIDQTDTWFAKVKWGCICQR